MMTKYGIKNIIAIYFYENYRALLLLCNDSRKHNSVNITFCRTVETRIEETRFFMDSNSSLYLGFLKGS